MTGGSPIRREGPARADAGGPRLDARRHRRKAYHRRGRKAVRVVHRTLTGGATENRVSCMMTPFFLVFGPQGLFGERIVKRV